MIRGRTCYVLHTEKTVPILLDCVTDSKTISQMTKVHYASLSGAVRINSRHSTVAAIDGGVLKVLLCLLLLGCAREGHVKIIRKTLDAWNTIIASASKEAKYLSKTSHDPIFWFLTQFSFTLPLPFQIYKITFIFIS